jgi:hypothetical protein
MLLQSLNSVRKNEARTYPGTDHLQKLRGPAIPVVQNILISPQKTDYFQSSAPIAPPPVRFGQTSQLEQWLNTCPSLKGREAILNYLIDINKFERTHVSCAFRVVSGVKEDLEKAQKTSGSERTQHLKSADAKLHERAEEIQKGLSYRHDLDKAYLYYEVAEIHRNQALIAKLLDLTHLLYADQQNINLYKNKCKENYQQGQLLISEMKKHKPYPDKLPTVEKAYKTCDILELFL